MERIYIENDNARITFNEGILVNVEMYDGRVFEGLEARRLFPVTGIDRYISLLDDEGNEKAVIRDINSLMDESKEVIKKALDEYYLVPKVLTILECYEKFGLMKMKVETDRGTYSFDIKSRYHDIKILYDGRVLLRDSSDNRYEIENYNKLYKNSKRLFNSYM